MTVFYQHIGGPLWRRDAPRSIGTSVGGVRRFRFNDIEQFLAALDAYEILAMRAKANDLAPTGFQIWGIPEGARRVLAKMDTGDFLMLRESDLFRYVGQVIHRTSQPCWDLSRHIWGEASYPLIVLLQGELIEYPWNTFHEQFGFASNFHMRGNTMRLARERIAASSWRTEETFIAGLLTTTGTKPFDLETDFRAFANNLEVHFRLVKARAAQQQFRSEVLTHQGNKCAVCDIAFPAVLEAAHIVPKEHDGTDDHRNGMAFCAFHHRMFDANMFAIDPETLALCPAGKLTLEQLRMTRNSIDHLAHPPHKVALKWRWSNSHKPVAENP
jgi:HNH endonuclease